MHWEGAEGGQQPQLHEQEEAPQSERTGHGHRFQLLASQIQQSLEELARSRVLKLSTLKGLPTSPGYIQPCGPHQAFQEVLNWSSAALDLPVKL